jgi:hypothetical protein
VHGFMDRRHAHQQNYSLHTHQLCTREGSQLLADSHEGKASRFVLM